MWLVHIFGPYFFKESSELIAFIHNGVTLCSELLFWPPFIVHLFESPSFGSRSSLHLQVNRIRDKSHCFISLSRGTRLPWPCFVVLPMSLTENIVFPILLAWKRNWNKSPKRKGCKYVCRSADEFQKSSFKRYIHLALNIVQCSYEHTRLSWNLIFDDHSSRSVNLC